MTYIVNMFILVALVTTACFMARSPLLGVPGYETAAAAALFFSAYCFAAGVRRGTSFAQSLTGEKDPHIFTMLVKNYLAAITIAAVQLTAFSIPIFLKSQYVTRCNTFGAIHIYLLILVPVVLHFTALGFFAGALFRRTAARASLFVMYFLATFAVTAAEFYFGPHMVMHNVITGLVSTSGVYGSELIVNTPFYCYRILVAFSAVSLLAFASHIAVVRSVKSGATQYEGEAGLTTAVLVAAFIFICLIIVPDETGLGFGNNMLSRELSETYPTKHATLHYAPETLPGDRARVIAAYADWWLTEIYSETGIEPDRSIDIFLYENPQQLARLTGLKDTYFSKPWKFQINIIQDEYPHNIFKHELVHAVLAQANDSPLRIPANLGLLEGAATAYEHYYHLGPGFQRQFAAAQRAGVISSGHKAVSNKGFASGNMWKSYDMAGAFSGYLIYKYGSEKFLRLYGGASYEKAFGKSLPILADEWRDWLSRIPVSRAEISRARFKYSIAELPPTFTTTCPRIGHACGDFAPSTRTYSSAASCARITESSATGDRLFALTNNSSWLTVEIEKLIENSDYSRAVTLATKTAANKNLPGSTRNKSLSLLAYTYSLAGDYSLAQAAIRQKKRLAFELPEDTHAQLLIAQRPRIRTFLLAAYLLKDPGYEPYVRAISEDPLFPIPYYEAAKRIKPELYSGKERFKILDLKMKLTKVFVEDAEGFSNKKYDILIETASDYEYAALYNQATALYKQAAAVTPAVSQQHFANERAQRTLYITRELMQ